MYRYVWDNGHGLTILYKLTLWSKVYDYVMMGIGSNNCFVTGTPCLIVGHNYGFASSVGHPRSDSVGLLVYDGMRTYPGHRSCIIGSSRQRQPCQERVNILSRLYEINYDLYVY